MNAWPRILNSRFELDTSEMPLWNLSYSMQGEDLLLRSMVKGMLRRGETGFYVDLGSFDCRYGSNTYLFYKYGWRGICVEANPRFADQYAQIRPRDVFINAAVGEPGPGYWVEAASTPSSRVVRSRDDIGIGSVGVTEMPFVALTELFDRHVPTDKEIDILCMDIEGGELSALRSNDWSRYKPRIVVIEINTLDVEALGEDETLNFLRERGYRVTGVLFPNVFLARN